MMTLKAGAVFGKAAKKPTFQANAVLGLQIDCSFGGPNFLSKNITNTKINTSFLIN